MLFDPTNQSGMEDSLINASNISAANLPNNSTPTLVTTLSTDRVAPLQRENLRLVRSNNTLQAHLIKESERIEECERNWAQEMRVLKSKHADLQFLHSQKTRKIANVSEQRVEQ